MDAILTNLTPMTLTAAIEDNLFALFRAIGRLPGGELDESDELLRFSTRLPSAFFNGVARTRVESVSPDLLPQPFFWWTGPQSEPPDLDERLVSAGLRPAGRDWPGMAMALNEIDEAAAFPSGVAVEQVGGEAAVSQWVASFCAAHALPPASGDAWLEAAQRLQFRDIPWQHWVARIDREVVGVGLSFLGAGVVGLYGIGTLPAARRRGVGSALTLVPMLQAREAGYRAAVLQATPDGERLYSRLGFRTYCTVSRFLGGV